jgi:glycosyltransferase involved in cell wall biosynthesis
MASKIRVLLLTDEMEIGGTQRQIVHIARRLNRAVFEPAVCYFRNRSEFVEQLEQSCVPVIEIAKKRRFDLPFIARLSAMLREKQFDVMHCFAFSGELWGACARLLQARSKRPALITSVRGVYDWYSPIQKQIKQWVSSRSYRVIANSKAGAEYANATFRVPVSKLEVVANGVEFSFKEKNNSCSSPPSNSHKEGVSALFIGRLVESKNIAVLLRSMKRLKDSGFPIRLTIAGEGPLHAEIDVQIESLGLKERVEMLGQRNDVESLIRSADFIVQPSLQEGLSNTILETMYVGRPVIASSVGGNVELVEPMKTGLLFSSNDDAGLADAMQMLANQPALRMSMGTNARARAADMFSVERMLTAMERIYRDAALGRDMQQSGADAGI